ncbi:hypothetical protein CPA56_08375 [Bombella sp. TMW2.1889]|uniref:Uncharacterized protein n=1 Tax=Bombella mellum TaxID=2039288 RepID=A0ABR5ZUH4_9PROT|nr:hypothetical protein [Bombella mellum]
MILEFTIYLFQEKIKYLKKISYLTENENKNLIIISENIDNLVLILDYIYDFFSRIHYSNDYYIKRFPISKDFF